MINWWGSLSTVSQVFALVAIPTTLVLLIQTVLMLIGIGLGSNGADDISAGEADVNTDIDTEIDTDIDTELDADIDTDGGDGIFGSGEVEADADPTGLDSLRFFTVRGIIAFFVVFGWTGFMLDGMNVSLYVTIPVAILSGLAMMYLLALLMKWVMKLRNNGNTDNRNALGTSGKVYLTVPPNRSGEGKVNVLLQGSYVEREAVTDEDEAIPTGAEIVVIGVSGQTALIVKRK